ncbi:MAG: hypothetical protein PSV13_18140 [Lacunisphaera sp.]|nr:hypothetical protein [Lacunisphaera sp.]
MKPPPPEPPKDFAKDLKTFQQLPARTKELELTLDAAEKSTGPERVALERKLQAKSN